MITIQTNNHPRDLLTLSELTPGEAEWFDYVDSEEHYSPRFVRAYGNVYDVNEYSAYAGLSRESGMPAGLEGWHGYASDSYWSGTVIRYADDQCESVVIGRFYVSDES